MAEQKTIGQIAEDAWRENVAKIEAGEPTAPCWEAAASDVWDQAVAKCIEAIREQSETFASEEYATGQPHSSFGERFACTSCIEALETLKRSDKTENGGCQAKSILITQAEAAKGGSDG